MKTIKKYINRRLYDTQASQYITFEELKQFINENIEFEIVDSKTGEDISSPTLLQLLVENQDKQAQILPKQLLITLIKYGEHPVNQYMNQILNESMQFYNQEKSLDNFQSLFKNMTSQTQNLFEQWQSAFTPKSDKK